MLSTSEYDRLIHDLKRAATVLKFVREESDHDKRQTFIGLLVDELDRLGKDLEDAKEKHT